MNQTITVTQISNMNQCTTENQCQDMNHTMDENQIDGMNHKELATHLHDVPTKGEAPWQKRKKPAKART